MNITNWNLKIQRNLTNKSAVYLLKINGEIVYVGATSNAGRRVRRFFKSPHCCCQLKLAKAIQSASTSVELIECDATNLSNMEKELFYKHRPKLNQLKPRFLSTNIKD